MFGNSTGNSYLRNPSQNTWSRFCDITESNIWMKSLLRSLYTFGIYLFICSNTVCFWQNCGFLVFFQLRWVAPVLKHCKVSNIIIKIVWQFFSWSVHFPWSFEFFEKAFIWLKKVSSIKKLPISKLESFLKTKSDLKETFKITLMHDH